MFKNCKVVGKDIAPAKYHAHEIQRGDKRHPASMKATISALLQAAKGE